MIFYPLRECMYGNWRGSCFDRACPFSISLSGNLCLSMSKNAPYVIRRHTRNPTCWSISSAHPRYLRAQVAMAEAFRPQGSWHFSRSLMSPRSQSPLRPAICQILRLSSQVLWNWPAHCDRHESCRVPDWRPDQRTLVAAVPGRKPNPDRVNFSSGTAGRVGRPSAAETHCESASGRASIARMVRRTMSSCQ